MSNNSKYNAINRTSIPNLTSDYISANSRLGGSYLSNYHKHLPKILMGLARSGGKDVFVSCDDLAVDADIIVSGYIENEYVLSDLKLYYRIGSEDDYTLVDREPYAEWSFKVNSTIIYTSNSSKIELKLEGQDSQGKDHTIIENYNLVIEENCIGAIDCKESITETIVDLMNISLKDMFKIDINGQIFYAESLEDLKNILLRNNVEVEVYTKTLN